MFLIIFLFSCAPANYISNQGDSKEAIIEKPIINNKITKKEQNELSLKKTLTVDGHKYKNLKTPLSKNITVLISKTDDPKIVDQFLNIIELATYKKKIKNISFNIHVYENNNSLNKNLEKNISKRTP